MGIDWWILCVQHDSLGYCFSEHTGAARKRRIGVKNKAQLNKKTKNCFCDIMFPMIKSKRDQEPTVNLFERKVCQSTTKYLIRDFYGNNKHLQLIFSHSRDIRNKYKSAL